MPPSILKIKTVVATHYGFSVKELEGWGHNAVLNHARGVAIYLSRKLTSFSYQAIGRSFGGRDHSTVVYTVKRVERKGSSQELDFLSSLLNHSTGDGFTKLDEIEVLLLKLGETARGSLEELLALPPRELGLMILTYKSQEDK